MKKLFILAMVLGAFVATNVYANPQPLDIYGGYDPAATPTWWYILDHFGNPLPDGALVLVFWKGPNGIPESPDLMAPGFAGGDDILVKEGGVSWGGFYLTVTTWQAGTGTPEPCDEIFVVIFDGPDPGPSNYYTVSEQYHVENVMGEVFYAHFPGDPNGPPPTDWIHIPVELMSFDAIARDGEVLLEWKTATESDCFGFHIERDGERITDEAIAAVGNSDVENTYTYVDKGLENGISYAYNLVTVDMDGVEQVANESPVSASPTAHMPTEFALHQNYPNPFNPWTDIKYDVPQDVHVTLKVYNVLGAEVATLVDIDQKANFYTVRWDAKDLASGVYFCRIAAGDYKAVKKMVLLK